MAKDRKSEIGRAIFALVCMAGGGVGMYLHVPYMGWAFAIGVIAGLSIAFD